MLDLLLVGLLLRLGTVKQQTSASAVARLKVSVDMVALYSIVLHGIEYRHDVYNEVREVRSFKFS